VSLLHRTSGLRTARGRVHRFKGHAVRKNIGAAHREQALRLRLPTLAAAFAAAELRRQPT